MGDRTFSRVAYLGATKGFAPDNGPVTRAAEEQAHNTGKLNPLVDPAEYGVIRRSLPRLVKDKKTGLWRLTVGTPMPIETRLDTTGSMGNNVDIAFRVLPDMHRHCSEVLPGYDLQIATGIFGDCQDRFVLCRPQFEMEAEKLVHQLSLMVPERGGWGNGGEDPHYGIFGAAYLTAAHINRLGLKGYDFTVSDEPARYDFSERQLTRVFGDDVFDKVKENGFEINRHNLPSTQEVVRDLLGRVHSFPVRGGKGQNAERDSVFGQAHAFFLQVGDDRATKAFWTKVFGKDRVVMLPSTELLPQVQATIIGLTEGTLTLDQVAKFLNRNNVNATNAEAILRSVANIPIGAQAALPNFSKRPQKGDLFREKTDVWPVDQNADQTEAQSEDSESEEGGPNWL